MMIVLFYNAFNVWVHIFSNDRMIREILKNVKRKGLALIWCTIPAFSWKDWDNYHKLLKIVSFWSDNWTGDLQSTRQKCPPTNGIYSKNECKNFTEICLCRGTNVFPPPQQWYVIRKGLTESNERKWSCYRGTDYCAVEYSWPWVIVLLSASRNDLSWHVFSGAPYWHDVNGS
jgi:hypothetical protein